eukprot:GHVS01084876.1.p1 GENE.GHVS01084876.1~~GHVS01084876.1.p1  ORF type:complete len:102 (+),score=10.89 GHVS01084876.1:350-655(+)
MAGMCSVVVLMLQRCKSSYMALLEGKKRIARGFLFSKIVVISTGCSLALHFCRSPSVPFVTFIQQQLNQLFLALLLCSGLSCFCSSAAAASVRLCVGCLPH